MTDHIVFLTRAQAGLLRSLLVAFQQNRDPEKFRATIQHAIAELDERMSPELEPGLFIGIPLREPR